MSSHIKSGNHFNMETGSLSIHGRLVPIRSFLWLGWLRSEHGSAKCRPSSDILRIVLCRYSPQVDKQVAHLKTTVEGKHHLCNIYSLSHRLQSREIVRINHSTHPGSILYCFGVFKRIIHTYIRTYIHTYIKIHESKNKKKTKSACRNILTPALLWDIAVQPDVPWTHLVFFPGQWLEDLLGSRWLGSSWCQVSDVGTEVNN